MKIFLFIILIVSVFLGISSFPRQADITKNEERIVGGNSTTIEKLPYNAQLYVNHEFWCGATIISPKWVLTAGHCTDEQSTSNVTLRVGATEYNQTANEPVTLAEIYIHPLYNITTLDYDISILLLNKHLAFGEKIAAVALPPSNVVLPAGTLATVSGWGRLVYQGDNPPELHEVTVPIVSNEECALDYSNDTGVYVTDRVLCAGYEEGGKGGCNGDSGGPLTVDGILYGLVSSGVGCAEAGFPGTYVNVSSLRSYIASVTGL
ncbi:trypsin-1-like [Agrilus planipennis]|uniref:Trypsin-1-like n=1 Tax=Agrilus planipennis TaxID=224129 RepID=A0A7F5RH69_AGRPL|nr:trypsin-1-like [Agrilus planipennis]